MDRLLILCWEWFSVIFPSPYVRELRKFGIGMTPWRFEERERGCWDVGWMIQEELRV
jgi:hypothetical protein